MASAKNTHVVLEIDGDRWSVTVADVLPRRFTVSRCHCPEETDPDGGDASEVIAWLGGQNLLESPLHLVVADATVRRFETTLPTLSRAEVGPVLERQARSLCSLEPGHPLRVAHRVVGKVDKKRTLYSALAVQIERRGGRSLAQQIITHEDLNVASVCDMGEAVLHALPGGIPEHLAVVDANSQGLRFVYLEKGVLKKERRISWSGDNDALADVLTVEIPRTLDHMVDLGFTAPDAVAFAPGLGLDDDAQARAACGLRVVDIEGHEQLALAEGDHPGLGAIGLLQHLAHGGGLTALDFKYKRPRALMVPVVCGLLLLVSAGGVVAGIDLQKDVQAANQRVGQVEAEFAQWQVERERIERDAKLMDAAHVARLDAVLGMRWPASLLFAEVSNAVPDGVHLAEISYTEAGDVLIRGHVESIGRLQAIRLLGAYRSTLVDLPFLQELTESVEYRAGGGDTAGAIGEGSTDEAGAGVLTFQLTGRWGT